MNGPTKECWIRFEQRYFVRFACHSPHPGVVSTSQLKEAYCFPSLEDAERVVEQLRRYGWISHVVERRQAHALPVSSTRPPSHLIPWINKIIEASRGRGSQPDLKAGFRALVLQFHPDVGGLTADMQDLNEAFAWLQENNELALDPDSLSHFFDEDEIIF